jgi:hypothetical protein
MTRRRDHLIDKKIGSVIRMQRVKLGMSQGELGNGLGVNLPANSEIREWHKRGGFDANPSSVPNTGNVTE